MRTSDLQRRYPSAKVISTYFTTYAWVGLLVVDDERFAFATPKAVQFDVPRSEIRR
jgi:hypothetical protein